MLLENTGSAAVHASSARPALQRQGIEFREQRLGFSRQEGMTGGKDRECQGPLSRSLWMGVTHLDIEPDRGVSVRTVGRKVQGCCVEVWAR